MRGPNPPSYAEPAHPMTGRALKPGRANPCYREIARRGHAAIQRDSTGLYGDRICSAVRFDLATALLVWKIPARPRSGAGMGAGRSVPRLQLLNRIQRKMAGQSSVAVAAALAVLAGWHRERSRRVVRCRDLSGDGEEAASTARSATVLGGHSGDCGASCRGAPIPRGAAYKTALHSRSVAHPFRRERAPEHPVRCPGIWLRSSGP
jgi:hypothetical protein